MFQGNIWDSYTEPTYEKNWSFVFGIGRVEEVPKRNIQLAFFPKKKKLFFILVLSVVVYHTTKAIRSIYHHAFQSTRLFVSLLLLLVNQVFEHLWGK